MIVSFWASAQTITGVVYSKESKEPIPFATIAVENEGRGTVTDIDGKFSISVDASLQGRLEVNHVGYEELIIPFSQLLEKPNIYLTSRLTALDVVVFEAGENPANPIIRSVIKNRKRHDPSKLDAYKVTSYTKEIFKLESQNEKADSLVQSVKNKSLQVLSKKDSSILRVDSTVRKNHLFLSETVAELKYISPNVVNEIVLATNVTGSKGDMFAATGSEYQSFGFYSDVFKISTLEKEFVSPINASGLARYDFYIEDTTFYESDTVFVISFEPKKNARFEALKGVLFIHSKDYAITNVIAESTDPYAKVSFKVQQVYDKIGAHWFPIQLNTTLTFEEIEVNYRKMILENKRYLSDIDINPSFTMKDFNDIALAIENVDEIAQQRIIQQKRHEDLDSMERSTFSFIEDKNLNLESIEKLMEILITQRIPVGKVDIKIEDFFGINRFEKFRLGLGLETNDEFSKKLRFGGYGAYGFGDENWKYGGDIKWEFNRRTKTNFLFKYNHDIKEIGRFEYFNESVLSFADILRVWQGDLFDSQIGYNASFYTNITPFIKAQVSYSSNQESPNYLYTYNNGEQQFSEYELNEVAASFKYSKKERYLSIYGRRVLIGYEYPVFQFRYSQGNASWLDSDMDFRRFDLSFEYRKNHRLGRTHFTILGGYITGDVPFGRLLTGIGNGPSNWSVPNYFQTMGLYEFASDKMTALYLKHNFGNILIENRLMKPELLIFQNSAIGDINAPEYHEGVTFSSMEKGYFESGIGLQNLFRFNYANFMYVGFGIEGFYRYGSYTFAETNDNIFAKLNIKFSF
ncbi:MAG: carboxypeptidase-like regulatory domain-containing protein [Reichenbachiella sp.]